MPNRDVHVKTSAEWLTYFAANASRQRMIPWRLGAGVSAAELTAIACSLRGWQLGETSDGAHLLAAARAYAAKVNDPGFVDVVRLFIAEEQRHGNYLGKVLDLAGVERAKSDWGDSLFRAMRYLLPSMEVWATPVVMVETHALIYYNAIRLATKSGVLRTICEQILADEVPHIQFQCERLAILHRRRPRWLRGLTMALHRVLFGGITIAVWLGHQQALKAGGYSLRSSGGVPGSRWGTRGVGWRRRRIAGSKMQWRLRPTPC
ncbi:MAG: ferritin-like domain-containing protein [Gemmataceae bacterium]|nr:ferritin-like domain-containing protein [Gemmataceae bacterium]